MYVTVMLHVTAMLTCHLEESHVAEDDHLERDEGEEGEHDAARGQQAQDGHLQPIRGEPWSRWAVIGHLHPALDPVGGHADRDGHQRAHQDGGQAQIVDPVLGETLAPVAHPGQAHHHHGAPVVPDSLRITLQLDTKY